MTITEWARMIAVLREQQSNTMSPEERIDALALDIEGMCQYFINSVHVIAERRSNSPPAASPQPLLDWQAVRYGDTDRARAAITYYRERGWAVDDRDNSSNDDRIYAFMSGYDTALAAAAARQMSPPAASPGSRDEAEIERLRRLIDDANGLREMADRRALKSDERNIELTAEVLVGREIERQLRAQVVTMQAMLQLAEEVMRRAKAALNNGRQVNEPPVASESDEEQFRQRLSTVLLQQAEEDR